MKKWPETETQLAEKVIEWLTAQGWDVYQEVQPFAYGNVADIVAVRGALLWIIETKRVLNMKVITQAVEWQGFANFVSVATPRTKTSYGLMDKCLRYLRIGRLEIDEHGDPCEWVKPALDRKILKNLKECLSEEHKTYAKAGNADGKRWTPFQGTARAVQVYVREHPGCTTKELIDNIKTHYSCSTTARSCLGQYIQRGIIKGIKCDNSKRILRFYTEKDYPKNLFGD